MPIEHQPAMPKSGWNIDGQKIAVVGYSHYVDGEDHEGVTQGVVDAFVRGKADYQFFKSIQTYFGYPEDRTFWSRVLFFNFVPDSVGAATKKYVKGSQEQLKRGRARFLRIIEEHRPDKVLVFSTKGWDAFPEETVEELAGETCKPLIPGQPKPNWGTYMAGDKPILVCGFHHPQGANRDALTEQVQRFLTLHT